MWMHRFTVIGRGSFPLDMLRYDGCFPATGEDVSKIGQSRQAGILETFSVELGHYDKLKAWRPTIARWASFGWRVEEPKVAPFKV